MLHTESGSLNCVRSVALVDFVLPHDERHVVDPQSFIHVKYFSACSQLVNVALIVPALNTETSGEYSQKTIGTKHRVIECLHVLVV